MFTMNPLTPYFSRSWHSAETILEKLFYPANERKKENLVEYCRYARHCYIWPKVAYNEREKGCQENCCSQHKYVAEAYRVCASI